MPDNIPEKHHFLPQFYLSRWAINDGKLVQFSRPNPNSGNVVPQRKYPAGTGYKPGAYAFEGLPPEKRGLLEKRMMQPLDTGKRQGATA